MALDIPRDWTDLNALTGLAVGSSLVLQNVGKPADLIHIYVGPVAPVDDPEGVALDQLNPLHVVHEPLSTVWVRFSRLDCADDTYPSLTGSLTVQLKKSAIVPIVRTLVEPSSYAVELARGNIENQSIVTVTGTNPDVDTTTPEIISDVGGADYPYPTAGARWQIVSTSGQDDIAGTGARTALLSYLDDNYVRQTEVIQLSGTTPALTTAADVFRLVELQVLTAGSSKTNEGQISITAEGGGDVYGLMGVGNARTFHGLYTVPDGTEAYFAGGYATVQKNKDANISIDLDSGGSGVFSKRLPFSVYQASFNVAPAAPLGPFPARSEIKPKCSTENVNTEVALLYGMLVIEL